MAKNKYRANSSEIWKRPNTIRYIWYIEGDTGNFSGMSWQAFNISLRKCKSVSIKLCDVIDDEVICLENMDNVKKFMKEWRDNYFDKDWRFKKI